MAKKASSIGLTSNAGLLTNNSAFPVGLRLFLHDSLFLFSNKQLCLLSLPLNMIARFVISNVKGNSKIIVNCSGRHDRLCTILLHLLNYAKPSEKMAPMGFKTL